MNPDDRSELETISEPARAAVALHPLRCQILQHASEPRSAADIARRLGLPRQKVNYHVRELASAKLLRKAGRVRKRNFVEQRWLATARTYALAPGVLGPVGADPRAVQAQLAAAQVIALGAQMQAEVAQASRESGQPTPTLALEAELRFRDGAQRQRFALALRAAIERVVAEHSTAAVGPEPAEDRQPFRLTVACYPIPPSTKVPSRAVTPPYLP